MDNKPKLTLVSAQCNGGVHNGIASAMELQHKLETHREEALLYHKNVLLFLNEPHNSAQVKERQDRLRQEEAALIDLNLSIIRVPKAEHREALQKTCNELLQNMTQLKASLGQERLELLQTEAKSPMTKLLIIAGFSAGTATSARAVFDRSWIIGGLTVFATVVAVASTYKNEIRESWKKASEKTCSNCDMVSCAVHKENSALTQGWIKDAFVIMRCKISAAQKKSKKAITKWRPHL